MLPVAAPELTKIIRPFRSPSFMCIHGKMLRSEFTWEKKLTSKWSFQASTFSCGLVILPVGSRTPAFNMRLSTWP